MYVPRHYDATRRKNSFPYFTIIFLILLVSGIVFLFSIRKEIALFFSGNSKQKVVRIQKKTTDSFKNDKLPNNVLNEYKSVVSLYYEVSPTDAQANYLQAKYYYYSFINTFPLNLSTILQMTSFERNEAIVEKLEEDENLEKMYLNAKRAAALGGEFQDIEANKVLTLFYELLAEKKKPAIILGELSILEVEKIPTDLYKMYLWTLITSSCLSGNLDALDNAINANDSAKDHKISIDSRTSSFLRGVAYYHGNDFIKALPSLRESKSGFDTITIESIKFESMIFFKQNLHDKSIGIIEKLYEETGKQDKKLLQLLKKILASKPGLKTKLNLEE